MPLKSWKVWGILFTIALCAGCFGFVPRGYAQSTFLISDIQAEYIAPEGDVTITGSSMVWLGKDEIGWNQIFSRNLETGELKQLTVAKSYKSNLSSGGDFAAYVEDRNLVLYNLQSGETTKSGIDAVVQQINRDGIRTDGHYVLYGTFDKMLHVYDMETKETKKIGEGWGASIANGIVVYSSHSEGGVDILLFDAQTGTSRVLQKAASQGYGNPAFNGKNVVWKIRVGMDFQHRILNVDEMDPLPQVLNVFPELPKFPTPIAIGGSVAAWSALDKGKDQIIAADLASRQTGIVADNGEKLIGIYLNKLVLKDKDNKVVLRSLTLSGQGNAITETLVSAVPIPDKKLPDQAHGQLGGRHPISLKQIALSDNSVIISIEDMKGDGNSSTITHMEDDLTLTKALAPGQKMVSQPWQVNIGSDSTNVKLSMTYLTQRVPSGQQDKLGIYRLDSGGWTYMGGLFEENNNRLYTDMIKSGVYIVLYYDVPNRYIRDYWQEKRIGQLNATKPIRVFLDGEELSFHEQPVLKDGTTTVEFRPIFEKLGLQIDWDGVNQTITGTNQGKSLKLTLGQLNADVNGSSSKLLTAPFLNQGYAFVPLRFVGEASGRKVLWDPNLKAIYIYDPATEGKLLYSSGALQYEGQLKDGRMNGKGKLYREDGTLWYDAEFRENEVIGWGTLYFAGISRGRERTGEVSIGQFKGGLPEGYVINIDNNYLTYEGQVIQGVFNGEGKYYEMGQLVYDGEFKDNLFDGYGKYYLDGKLQFDGQFVKNEPNGYGKRWHSNGKLDFDGSFIQSVPNGYGKRYKLDGTLYEEGEYVNGKLQGK